jgi:hypothetical protein
LLTVAPFILVAVAAAIVGAFARAPQGQIAPGVQVGNVKLGGQSQDAARDALAQWAARWQSTGFVLHMPPASGSRRVWKTDAKALGLGVDVQATLDDANRAGQSDLAGRVSIWISGSKPVPIAAHPTVDIDKLRAYLKRRIAPAADHPAKNARLIPLKTGGFGLRHEKSGFALDLDASAAAITLAWNSLLSAAHPPPASEPAKPEGDGSQKEASGAQSADGRPQNAENGQETPTPNPQHPIPDTRYLNPDTPVDATLTTRPVEAAITVDDLKQVDLHKPLTSFTSYYTGIPNRRSNVALAASRINGTLLAPGEIFSYNNVVGPRATSAGFKPAPEIVRGEHKMGVGGGVCQVSSTLYNAVLLANLKIVQRQHHAFPIGYLPPGRDATVVYGALDFQFQNSTQAPIYIAASAHYGTLSFTIYGKRTPGREVSIQTVTHAVEPAPVERWPDPTLWKGEQRVMQDHYGHHGLRLSVYRVVRQDGQVVRRELIANDYYKPVARVILVGTREAAPKAAPAAPTKPNTDDTTPQKPPPVQEPAPGA